MRSRGQLFSDPLNDNEVICTLYNGAGYSAVPLKGRDMERMNPDNPSWLNDECVNAYLWLVTERGLRCCASNPNVMPVYFYSSHFMTKLLSGDVNIQRFSMKISAYLESTKHGMSIFDLGKLGFPINRDNNTHWSLAVVDFEKKKFLYFDSMHDKGKRGTKEYLTIIREYIVSEVDKEKSRGEEWIAETKVSPQYFLGRLVIVIGADCTAL